MVTSHQKVLLLNLTKMHLSDAILVFEYQINSTFPTLLKKSETFRKGPLSQTFVFHNLMKRWLEFSLELCVL